MILHSTRRGYLLCSAPMFPMPAHQMAELRTQLGVIALAWDGVMASFEKARAR